MSDLAGENARRKRAWDAQAHRYDEQFSWWERRLLGEGHRAWAAERARGEVLEVAVGTGLNLPLYGTDLQVTGLDLSPAMLAIAHRRAAEAGRQIDLREGDAHQLPFGDAVFDTVVCTYGLCNVPDDRRAVGEMHRVLRSGGRLVLVDHVRSTVPPIRWFQRGLEVLTVRIDGDRLTRRPAAIVGQLGFDVVERDRFRWGVVERLVARKPA